MRPHIQLIVVACTLLVLVSGGIVWWQYTLFETTREVVFAIPAGTAARVSAGEQLVAWPATITLTLGLQDTLVIRNDDTQTATLGPFTIEPGQRFVQRFSSPGSFDLICTSYHSQQMKIVVQR